VALFSSTPTIILISYSYLLLQSQHRKLKDMTQPGIQNKTSTTDHRGWRLTSRDLDILVAIYRFRFLTRQLIEWVFFSRGEADFDGRSSASGRRLQALHDAGYVERLVLPMLPGAGRAPLVYALSSRGADTVAGRLDIDRENVDWLPRHNRATAFFMEHTLGIARLWAALTAALRGTGVTIDEWIGEGELRKRDIRVYDYDANRHLPLRPDGYFVLFYPDDTVRCLFVEIDMGTETNDRVGRKMRAYDSYRRRGFEEEFEFQKFAVLVVTNGRKRMENLMRYSARH
jgi:hypothetical protein